MMKKHLSPSRPKRILNSPQSKAKPLSFCTISEGNSIKPLYASTEQAIFTVKLAHYYDTLNIYTHDCMFA